MNMTLTVNAQKQNILYYNCSYCQFNTLKLDISSDDARQLLLKVMLYKGKYQRYP